MDYKKYNNYRIIHIFYPSSHQYKWNKNDSERKVNYLQQPAKIVVHEENEYAIKKENGEIIVVLKHDSNPTTKYINNEIIDLFWIVDLNNVFKNYQIDIGNRFNKLKMLLESYYKRSVELTPKGVNAMLLKSIMYDDETKKYCFFVENFMLLVNKSQQRKEYTVRDMTITRY